MITIILCFDSEGNVSVWLHSEVPVMLLRQEVGSYMESSLLAQSLRCQSNSLIVVPAPTSLSSSIVPPNISTWVLTMNNPSPLPSTWSWKRL